MDYEGKLDCQTCDEKLQEERGHYTTGKIPFWVGREQIFRCPLTIITPLSWEYLKAFSFYEKGFLPQGKGTNDESKKYLQAMVLIENEFNKARRKKEEDGRNRSNNSLKAPR
jgi:hypothetical protein